MGQDIFVNQSGYNHERPKRFTAPNATDGAPFVITAAGSPTVLYAGTVTGERGDFSDFKPEDAGPYVVTVDGTRSSYPFNIGRFWIERVSYQRAVDFMIDSRRGFGVIDPPSATLLNEVNKGVAWRDADTFSFEISSLIQMFCSNPSAYLPDRMPVQGGYANLTVALPSDTPEIVRLIYWGVDLYLRAGVDHTLMKEQLAYFLFYYPSMSPWIPQSEYERVRDYLFPIWGKASITRFNSSYDIPHTADLFQVYTVFGSAKGAFPPGHSVAPNLMMYEVARREGWTGGGAPYEAQDYFDAAYAQTEWIIGNLDLQDPATTKGQRMSERVLMEGLAYFQRLYAEAAPPGLLAKIRTWADIAIARSDNLWDFRKYSDSLWIVPGYNEPGNVAGFPASAFAAIQVLTDPADATRRAALERIAMAQIDHVFGRNPVNRHFCYDATSATDGFEGVDRGWFTFYNGGIGRLKDARGVLDGSPKEDAYPYNPGAAAGYTEGWVAFNAAWNQALAYMAADDLELRIYDRAFVAEVTEFTPGNTYGVELRAPLNFKDDVIETGVVRLAVTSGDYLDVTVSETSADGDWFRGTFICESGAANPADAVLQAEPGDLLTASYGYGVLGVAVDLEFFDPGFRITTRTLPDAVEGIPYGPVDFSTVNEQARVTWSVAGGSLPRGLSLSADGTLTGTPSESGTFLLQISANDGFDIVDQAYALQVAGNTAPIVTTGHLPAGTAGLGYNGQLHFWSGNPPVSWSLVSGALPSGISLDAQGAITGIPSDTGTASFRVRVVDADGDGGERDLQLMVTQPSEVTVTIIDNDDTGDTVATGTWKASTFTPTYFGADYRHDDNSGKGTKSYRFRGAITPGPADVYGWWPADANRSSNTPFDILHSGGTTMVMVNQTRNGGAWQYLGTFDFLSGTAEVLIRTTDTDGFVMADAVKFEQSTGSLKLYEAFRETFFPGGSASPEAGVLDNPDHDGFANLLEYALHLDPNAPNGSGDGFFFEVGAEGARCRFVRDPDLADIAYLVEMSTDLSDWMIVYDSRIDPRENTAGNVLELDLSEAMAGSSAVWFRLKIIAIAP